MNTTQPQPHERRLTDEEKEKVERVTTFEQLRGVVYKFKGERRRWWSERGEALR